MVVPNCLVLLSEPPEEVAFCPLDLVPSKTIETNARLWGAVD